jgi:hypothetical protein
VGYLAIHEALNSEYKNAIQVLDNPVVKKRWCLSGRFTSNAFLAFLILHILCRPSRKIERESVRVRVRERERERERDPGRDGAETDVKKVLRNGRVNVHTRLIRGTPFLPPDGRG